MSTFERLRIDDPVLDRLRRAELARLLVVRAGQHLLANRRTEAATDLRAARGIDGTVNGFSRLLLALAARMPVLGVMAARAGRAVKHRLTTSIRR